MEGRRAPPPTPATIAAALANHNGGLEPLLEDALTLGGVSRPGSPVSAEVAEEAPAGGFRAEAVVSDSQEDAKTDEAAVVATCGSDCKSSLAAQQQLSSKLTTSSLDHHSHSQSYHRYRCRLQRFVRENRSQGS